MKPIEGMKTEPMHCDNPIMIGAWTGFLQFLLEKEEVVSAFKEKTGHDILSVLRANGLDKMIDEATGRDRTVVTAWADFVTEHYWGAA